MTTAETNLMDQATMAPAGIFDYGAGRINGRPDRQGQRSEGPAAVMGVYEHQEPGLLGRALR